jgi:uncharacterized membrane protein
MNKICSVAVLGILVASCGCNKSEPGGPGARSTANKTITGAPKNETFRISAPATSTSIKQGEKKEVDLTVERSKDLRQDVTLSFDAPKGVKVTPSTYTVKASDSDTKVRVTVEATKDAPVGEADVHVTAKPETGAATTADFKINVKGG